MKKERITITIDKKLLDKLDTKIEDKTFGTRSHALEWLMQRRKQSQRKTK